VLADVVHELDDESLWVLAAMAAEAYGAEHLAVLGGSEVEEKLSVPERFRTALALGEPLQVVGAGWLGGEDLLLVDVELVAELSEAA
jgi:hypothetical protein